MTRVSKTHFKVVREQYLTLSNKEYLSLTTWFYLLNVILLLIFKTVYVRPEAMDHIILSPYQEGDIIVYSS